MLRDTVNHSPDNPALAGRGRREAPGEGDSPRTHMQRICGSSPSPQPSPRKRGARGVIDYAAGTGSAVTDLIFSIAKREVTFFSGTALISFL